MIDRYPLEDKIFKKGQTYEPKLLFDHRNYVNFVPAFIKAVDFTDSHQVSECYKYLETSEKAKTMKPEEALALLDSEFGDERIRIFAI